MPVFVVPLLLLAVVPMVSSECLVDKELNDVFSFDSELGREVAIPRFGSCCMEAVCGLACPTELPGPGEGYSVAVIVAILVSFIMGVSTYFLIKGSYTNFFVAGRSLPLLVVSMTLAAQSIDSNSLLGNVDLSYKFSFWDGAVLPLGLGISLILNGIFLADKINEDHVLTLPDVFAKRYGATVEILVSLATIVSFIMLLAGNLVGMGVILSYVWDINETGAIWISSAIIWSYTVSGGLYSVAYTDVLQGSVGWIGCLATAYWFVVNEEPNAPPPSIGFPGYVYPDLIGDDGVCDMYNGVSCASNSSLCCYNEEKWCPKGYPSCDRYDRAAYPVGDVQALASQMTDPYALSPFPNAILWNWATIVILSFGNLAALDFQARCMASRSPRNASIGCIFGGFLTILIGLPFSFLGSITRTYYGPDATNSVFEADSCSVSLGLPTCAAWVPDKIAFVKLLTHEAPPFLGGWCLIGIIAATMSTADGAILALGTVMSNNCIRHLRRFFPESTEQYKLLIYARISTLPLTIIATAIAAFFRSLDDHAAGATGYLLIVAFDVVLATVVVPLFGAFYAKNPSPRAALLSILFGGGTRIALEFLLPKDGSLLLPFQDDVFRNYGTAASSAPPSFIDVNVTEHWDPTNDVCEQELFRDFTGADSLGAPLVGLVVFLLVQWIENKNEIALFLFPGDERYDKDDEDDVDDETKQDEWSTATEIALFFVGIIFLFFTVAAVLLQSAIY